MDNLFIPSTTLLRYQGNSKKLKFQFEQLDKSDWFSSFTQKENFYHALLSLLSCDKSKAQLEKDPLDFDGYSVRKFDNTFRIYRSNSPESGYKLNLSLTELITELQAALPDKNESPSPSSLVIKKDHSQVPSLGLQVISIPSEGSEANGISGYFAGLNLFGFIFQELGKLIGSNLTGKDFRNFSAITKTSYLSVSPTVVMPKAKFFFLYPDERHKVVDQLLTMGKQLPDLLKSEKDFNSKRDFFFASYRTSV